MSCLVTGATGFVGSALVTSLRDSGIEVDPFGRDTVSDAVLARTDTLIHCAGIAHRAASDADYRQQNYQQTLALAKRAQSCGVCRFIFISSVNASGSDDSYGRWKLATERELIRQHQDTGLSVICLRPALVYGPGVGGNLAMLVSLVRRGMPTPPAGECRSMIGRDDLCKLIVELTEVDIAHGTVLVATDGESYSLARLHAAICRGLGREPGPARWPKWCWACACAGYDLLRGRPLSGDTRKRLFCAAEYSNQSSLDALQWRPRQRFEDCVNDVLEARA